MKLPSNTVLRLKLILEAILCSPAAGGLVALATGNRIRNNGLVIQTDDPAYSSEVKARLFWNLYERAEIRFISAHLDSRLDVVELGGSLGITAAHVASQLSAEARYVVVEANQRLLPALEANLARHAPGRRWAIEHGAITELGGEDVPFAVAESSYASRLSDPRHESPSGSVEWVPAMTLADILRRHEVGSFCLISDIEGAEASFVYGDPSVLDACEQAVIEFHDTVYDGRETTAEEMKIEFAERHRFRLVEERGPVAMFQKGLAPRS